MKYDVIEIMIKVIEDSWDVSNKVHMLDRYNTLIRLTDYAINTDAAYQVGSSEIRIRKACDELLSAVLIRRRGYVFQDLMNIIYLGYEGTLRQEDKSGNRELADPGHYIKWFERYGINPTEVSPYNKGEKETRRSAMLRTAMHVMNKKNELSAMEVMRFLANIPYFSGRMVEQVEQLVEQ